MIISDFQTRVQKLQATFKDREIRIEQPESEFPELWITVPDSWKTIVLAPLYDIHIGNSHHDRPLFLKHRNWIADQPNVLAFNGGDLWENANPSSPGASVIVQEGTPQSQMEEAEELTAPIQHKIMFSLPGNHEDRTFNSSGSDSAKQYAQDMQLPYFPDYCFCTIKWRGNNFRLAAHHGSGASTTPGAQRNAARKDMPWLKFDIYWTGHLHQPMADVVYATDFDQRTGEMFERSSAVVISPSYLKYFGSYAAKKRLAAGGRGLGVITLNEDGRIDVSLHARGKRL